MSQAIGRRREGGVTVLTFERPEKKNALNQAMYLALAEAMAEAEQDGTRALVFTGAGGAFTAGNDMNDFLESPDLGPESPVGCFLKALAETPLPLVAAVEGVAVGIGTTMLLHCDFVVAGQGARFQLPFVNLGLVPEAASSLLLPLAAGHLAATRLLMLGEAFDATEALTYSIVGEVVAEGEAEARGLALAEQLAERPAAALAETKRLLRAAPESVEGRMARESEVFARRLKSPELAEAVAAFRQKRKPDFSKVTS